MPYIYTTYSFSKHTTLTHTTSFNSPNYHITMANEPNEVRWTILRRLRRELEAEVTLANNLLTKLTRYLEQMRSRGTEMTRVHSLPLDHPFISYDLHTLLMTTETYMCNANNLRVARYELPRRKSSETITEQYKSSNHVYFRSRIVICIFISLVS